MRTAIFHDYFGAIGGGERVVLQMAKALDAEIITTDTDALRKLDPHVPFISLGPTPKYRGFKQVAAFHKFSRCDFSREYDFFIFSGNWAHYAAHRHHPNLWYCHTPIRAFYDLYNVFLERLDILSRQEFRIWSRVQRNLDQQSVKNVNTVIANSENVRRRIRTTYGRDAEVIYPPVDTRRFSTESYGNFWLSVNRIYPEKRIELQLEVFRNIPDERLIIVGGYAQGDHATKYAARLQRMIPPNVTFMGEVPEQHLLSLYANCKGLICTAIDEDFGLTPLEAMASGKPVVAVDEGGFRETVTPRTGFLIAPSQEEIGNAIRVVSKNPGIYRDDCIARAQEFDLPRFEEKMKKTVEHAYSAYQGTL